MSCKEGSDYKSHLTQPPSLHLCPSSFRWSDSHSFPFPLSLSLAFPSSPHTILHVSFDSFSPYVSLIVSSVPNSPPPPSFFHFLTLPIVIYTLLLPWGIFSSKMFNNTYHPLVLTPNTNLEGTNWRSMCKYTVQMITRIKQKAFI